MRLSIIIPTWQEAEHIYECVLSARAVADEVVVADCGSDDGTPTWALEAGATVVNAPAGRGLQLHRGASAATGDVLLFLHADTLLGEGARDAVAWALTDPAVVGGNFLLRFEPAGFWAKVFGAANDYRRRLLDIYYGDSAIFVRRQTYDRIGGFRPLPIMEDYDFVRRLERAGETRYIRHVVASTSSRRFQQTPMRALAVWATVQGLYTAGVSPHTLARLYTDIR